MDVVEKVDENGSPMLVVTTPKTTHEYYVQKTNDGFVFYHIQSSVGRIPKRLSGMYTRMDRARDDLLDYIRTMPKTKVKERDDKWRRSVASKPGADSKEPVQQGTAD